MPQQKRNPFRHSALVDVLICLRDLMAKTERYSSRVAFTDDVVITPRVRDVSDTIKAVRDALCHLDSPNHDLVPTGSRITAVVV
jgi:hypothetical protein